MGAARDRLSLAARGGQKATRLLGRPKPWTPVRRWARAPRAQVRSSCGHESLFIRGRPGHFRLGLPPPLPQMREGAHDLRGPRRWMMRSAVRLEPFGLPHRRSQPGTAPVESGGRCRCGLRACRWPGGPVGGQPLSAPPPSNRRHELDPVALASRARRHAVLADVRQAALEDRAAADVALDALDHDLAVALDQRLGLLGAAPPAIAQGATCSRADYTVRWRLPGWRATAPWLANSTSTQRTDSARRPQPRGDLTGVTRAALDLGQDALAQAPGSSS